MLLCHSLVYCLHFQFTEIPFLPLYTPVTLEYTVVTDKDVLAITRLWRSKDPSQVVISWLDRWGFAWRACQLTSTTSGHLNSMTYRTLKYVGHKVCIPSL